MNQICGIAARGQTLRQQADTSLGLKGGAKITSTYFSIIKRIS